MIRYGPKCIFMSLIILFLTASVSYGADDGATQLTQAVFDTTTADTDISTAPAAKIDSLIDGIQGKISLDLRNIDIVDALKFLALKAGLNMVTTKNVSGRITLVVENVTVQDIFDIMLRSNELAYMKQGNIYNIMTETEYKTLFGKNFADIREVRTFRLKYAIPEQAFTLLDTLKSDIGRVLVEPDSGTVMIMDTPDNIKEIEKALAMLDKKNFVKVFKLKYARATDIEEQLKVRLDAKKVGTVKANERSNLIIVQALPERMEEIESLIASLDHKTKEVLINTKIIKIKLINDYAQNFEWEGLFNVGIKYGLTYFGSYPFSVLQTADEAFKIRHDLYKETGGQIGQYPFSGTTDDFNSSKPKTLGEEMHVGIANRNRDFDLFMKLLRSIGDTRIISNPKLAVINNHEARIHVGERQAYVTTTTTTGQTTTTVSEEVTFVDIGIQLAVTPTINDDKYITMKIKPEISSVTDHLVTPSGNRIPIIDTSVAETTVMVKDGATIIIGGLRKEEETETTDKTPVLGDIPLLSFFFKSSVKGKDRTELMILITPTIVEGDKLRTGDRKDLAEAAKDYKEYGDLADDEHFRPLSMKISSQEEIKPYREYKGIAEDAR